MTSFKNNKIRAFIKILELLINQLFETGRINEIEYYYTQSSNLKINQFQN